ncbi:ABC transporter permease [Planobispora longispora]|uniref:Transport permease protein n=1 Tax=Planobispora longispora TaxID=28887 RepID=A0A8J3RKN5_9ACTN|nr:ABC transporter permease [Planobispora longispora]GIH75354.1 transport permease protein [Planobispora longispora]
MNKMILVEAKLFLREPGALIFAIMLPLGLLLGLGMIPDFQEASPEMGGQRVIDNHLPAMMTILAVVTMALTVLPGTLAAYREAGVLRRMSTTPVSPFRLLVAQLVNNLVIAVIATALLIGLSNLVHGTPLPGSPLAFAGVFLLGTASMFGLGLLIAALAPTAKAAPGVGSILMFPLLFMAGMWIPRELMPDLVRQIGDFLPMAPFAQALRDTWAGNAPQMLHLIVMAATLAVTGGLAARFFRWQ